MNGSTKGKMMGFAIRSSRRYGILLLALTLFSSCMRIPNFFKGQSFTFQHPAGWVKEEREMYPPFDLKSRTKKFYIAFDCPEKDPQTGQAVASISFFVIKPTMQVWLEDQFAELIQMFASNGFEVLDRGEIKIDDQISNWIVYRDPQNHTLNLEFYVVNDNNILFRIQYSAREDKFAFYRQTFEVARNSIKLSRW